VLVEVVAALKERNLFPNPNFAIFVDGGVRRATDVLKAIALGATAGMYIRLHLPTDSFRIRNRYPPSTISWHRAPLLVRILCLWGRGYEGLELKLQHEC
jgi:FMN-dependent dehydrogenase